jgi:D-alanyl-D-alanine carboxypeptidase (penicillin-binding protein 5/6)
LHLVQRFVQPTRVRSRSWFPPLLVAALGLLLAGVAAPAAAAPPAPHVLARSGVVMDAASGAVLWQRRAHDPVLVASTTKILTALVASDAYPPSKVFTVPRAAEQVDGTRLGYRTGMRVSRRGLFTTLLLVSANDAAETLAAAYPHGGRAGFIRAMQAEADRLGCTDSSWRDPSGLDVAGHRGSAADLAVLGRALLARPELAKLAGSRSVRYRWPGGHVQWLTNHNHFVSRARDPGALGIKTGYTVKARSTIVAAQRRGDRVLVAVALGSDDMYGDVRAMLAYGFRVQPAPGAEVLGARPRQRTGQAASTGPEPAGRFEAGATAGPASRLRRAATRLLAVPLPLAACAGCGLLALGAVALAGHRRLGRR